jgi:hypothetical protein
MIADAAPYCGCCGVRVVDERAMWCSACSQHTGGEGQPWDRTWEARHNTPCPVILAEELVLRVELRLHGEAVDLVSESHEAPTPPSRQEEILDSPEEEG